MFWPNFLYWLVPPVLFALLAGFFIAYQLIKIGDLPNLHVDGGSDADE